MSNLQGKKEDYILSLDNSCQLTKMDIVEQNLNAIDFGYELCKREYEEKIRWIPVEEKLPESTKFVLCKCEVNGRVDYIVSKYYKSGWQLHVFYSKVVKVTHWRSFS